MKPLSPACAHCREPAGTCFPGPCKYYQAIEAAMRAACHQQFTFWSKPDDAAKWITEMEVAALHHRNQIATSLQFTARSLPPGARARLPVALGSAP